MANWCETTYKCVGSPKEIKELHNALKYIDKRKTSILKNGFGKWWLGNLIHKLGGDWESYTCRGEINDFYLDDNVLTINQATAWQEQEGVRQIIQEKFPSIKVYFLDEEPGLTVYRTNDAQGLYFPERFILDFVLDDHAGKEYFVTIEEAAVFVSNLIGYKVNPSVKELQDALDLFVEKQNDEDAYCEFHQYAIIS